MSLYNWLNKYVAVQLYSSEGEAIYEITGRVVDVSANVKVHNTTKDLLRVIDIKSPHGDYTASDGEINESWFAAQDCRELDKPFTN